MNEEEEYGELAEEDLAPTKKWTKPVTRRKGAKPFKGKGAHTTTMIPGQLTSYQQKQIDYILVTEEKIKQNHWDALDVTVECKNKDCNIAKRFNNSDDAIAFIKSHAGHFTWSTNNNAKPK